MATLAPHQPAETAPSHWQEGNPSEDALAHIPGEGGWPIVGNTFKMLADPHGQTRRMVEKYGRVYKNRAFGGWNVALIGALPIAARCRSPSSPARCGIMRTR